MDNKSISTLILSLEKAIIKDYSVAVTESSTVEFLDIIKNLRDMSISAHRDLFDLMSEKGWYQIQKAETNKIDEEYQKLSQEMSKLNG